MWRIIDISGDGYYLSVKNDNLSILKDNKEVLHACFADINSIICSGNNIVYTNAVIQKCLENKIPLTFCNKSHLPTGMLIPTFSINEYGQRLQIQIKASVPLKKQIWRQIIKEKLKNQSLCLKNFDIIDVSKKLLELSNEVKSGDSTCREGIGARFYFSSLFNNFNRDNNKTDILNSALNYGYIVVRNCLARAIVSSGLNPALGVFHSNNHNPFCLADDLIEPLRPIVDYQIKNNINDFLSEKELNSKLKKILVSIVDSNLYFDFETCKFTFALQKYVQSYFYCLNKKTDKICFPKIFK